MVGLPVGFSRRGDWLVGERHGIARVQCAHGTVYSVYAWEYVGDWFAELIGVRQALAEAVKLIGDGNKKEL